MKRILLLAQIVLLSSFAIGQNSSLTVTFKFAGIEEGYDHVCKTQVWVDDNMVGESNEVNESRGAVFTVPVPTGEHQLRIVNLALYEGAWEEHSIGNNYSIDCLWEGTQSFGKKGSKLFLLFDIDDKTVVSWKKMPKPAK